MASCLSGWRSSLLLFLKNSSWRVSRPWWVTMKRNVSFVCFGSLSIFWGGWKLCCTDPGTFLFFLPILLSPYPKMLCLLSRKLFFRFICPGGALTVSQGKGPWHPLHCYFSQPLLESLLFCDPGGSFLEDYSYFCQPLPEGSRGDRRGYLLPGSGGGSWWCSSTLTTNVHPAKHPPQPLHLQGFLGGWLVVLFSETSGSVPGHVTSLLI